MQPSHECTPTKPQDALKAQTLARPPAQGRAIPQEAEHWILADTVLNWRGQRSPVLLRLRC